MAISSRARKNGETAVLEANAAKMKRSAIRELLNLNRRLWSHAMLSHIWIPEKTRSLANRDLDLGNIDLVAQAPRKFLRGGALEEQ